MIVAPATARVIASCALGLADDLLSTLYLNMECPILFAPVAGAFLLLFANAFAAYATARALTSGTIPLVPLQIGSLLSGNVIADKANLGFALGFGMIVIVAFAMYVYNWTQKRAAKWLQ